MICSSGLAKAACIARGDLDREVTAHVDVGFFLQLHPCTRISFSSLLLLACGVQQADSRLPAAYLMHTFPRVCYNAHAPELTIPGALPLTGGGWLAL